MFIHSKRKIDIPDKIPLCNNNISVVSSFKLLGVTIDNKLTLSNYVTETKKKVLVRLHSIKKLLSFNVKLHFFKTFILPYFDYCLSLTIYMNKQQVTRLGRLYYRCLSKLLNIDATSISPIVLNSSLDKFKLFSFQHRILYRLMLFIHKIQNDPNSPSLTDYLKSYISSTHEYYMRPRYGRNLEPIKKKHGEKTFNILFKKIINQLDLDGILSLPFLMFKSIILNDFSHNNDFFNLFMNNFSSFNFTISFVN
jgi:hypothetical protein